MIRSGVGVRGHNEHAEVLDRAHALDPRCDVCVCVCVCVCMCVCVYVCMCVCVWGRVLAYSGRVEYVLLPKHSACMLFTLQSGALLMGAGLIVTIKINSLCPTGAYAA